MQSLDFSLVKNRVLHAVYMHMVVSLGILQLSLQQRNQLLIVAILSSYITIHVIRSGVIKWHRISVPSCSKQFLVLSPGIRSILLNILHATRELLTDIWNTACLFIDTPQPSTFNLHVSITDPPDSSTDQNETSVNDEDDSSHDGSDSEDEFDDHCSYNDHSD